MAVVLLLSGCADEPRDGLSSGAELPACDKVVPAVVSTLPGTILGVGVAVGGCGDVLAASDPGVVQLREDGAPCALHAWPAGFDPGDVRAVEPSGMLVVDKVRKTVLLASATQHQTWLAVDPADAATVLDADQGRCGHRFVALSLPAGGRLRRLLADGSVAWQHDDHTTQVAAACDGVYTAGATPSDSRADHNTAWLARRSLDGHEQWRRPLLGDGRWRFRAMGAFPGGFGVVAARLVHGYDTQSYDALAVSAAGEELARYDLGTGPCCGNWKSWTWVLRPVAWPGGHVTWVTGDAHSSPHDSGSSASLVTYARDGRKVISRSLMPSRPTASVVLPGGGLLITGDKETTPPSAWVVRLPACATPLVSP